MADRTVHGTVITHIVVDTEARAVATRRRILTTRALERLLTPVTRLQVTHRPGRLAPLLRSKVDFSSNSMLDRIRLHPRLRRLRDTTSTQLACLRLLEQTTCLTSLRLLLRQRRHSIQQMARRRAIIPIRQSLPSLPLQLDLVLLSLRIKAPRIPVCVTGQTVSNLSNRSILDGPRSSHLTEQRQVPAKAKSITRSPVL